MAVLRRERLQEGCGVVASAVHSAVDEKRWCAEDLAGGGSAGDVAPDPFEHLAAGAVVIEEREVQSELVGVLVEVVVFECVLAVEEQFVHLPEAAL